MRAIMMLLSVGLAALARPEIAVAQVNELPNVPVVSGGWHDKFWTHPDGSKFHYLEMGTGTPVILIHGSGGTAVNWMMNGLAASIARTNRVLAIDMRGHGQTVGPDGKRQRRTPNMDLDVLAFMDGLKIDKAHIGGFRWVAPSPVSCWRGRRSVSTAPTSAGRASGKIRTANSRR